MENVSLLPLQCFFLITVLLWLMFVCEQYFTLVSLLLHRQALQDVSLQTNAHRM